MSGFRFSERETPTSSPMRFANPVFLFDRKRGMSACSFGKIRSLRFYADPASAGEVRLGCAPDFAKPTFDASFWHKADDTPDETPELCLARDTLLPEFKATRSAEVNVASYVAGCWRHGKGNGRSNIHLPGMSYSSVDLSISAAPRYLTDPAPANLPLATAMM